MGCFLEMETLKQTMCESKHKPIQFTEELCFWILRGSSKLKRNKGTLHDVITVEIYCGLVRLDHCWGVGGGSGAHLGEGAVVTTTVETDFGEPVAMCCWSCCVCTVWMRTWRHESQQITWVMLQQLIVASCNDCLQTANEMIKICCVMFNNKMIHLKTCVNWTGVIKWLFFICYIKKSEIKAHLCGLSLLLQLLELLCCNKADWFVPCDQLCAGRHRGQDDVPAQTADTARRSE